MLANTNTSPPNNHNNLAELEDMVERVLALPPEDYERLSAAARMSHRIRMDDLAELKQELTALEAFQTSNEGGAI